MPVHDDLGIRMKEFYESVPKTRLVRRMPVAIRIDGKAFHTFTRGFKKPFDDILIKAMHSTMKYLCENIQGCVLGYTQSDEITLILIDYQTLDTSAWFDYEVQKICSISASMATMYFNKKFRDFALNYIDEYITETLDVAEVDVKYTSALNKAIESGAMFDARCFNIPREEVTNLIYWRQLDAIRNSIQMVGQANFSHKQLHGKSCNNIKEMLLDEKGISWEDDFSTYKKRGACCIRQDVQTDNMVTVRDKWVIDNEIPVFKGEDREYIDRLIDVG